MSSASNSLLSTLAHVLFLIVNQSCHAFAGGKSRDPFGAAIFASLTRDPPGSRLPANSFLKSSVEGSSRSAAPSPSSSGNGGLSGQQQLHVESQLQTWVREDSFPVLATVVETPSTLLLDRSLQTHFQFLRFSLLSCVGLIISRRDRASV